jgi:hypothetical protein
MTVSRELSTHKLDVGEYTLFYRKGNENHELGTGFLVHKRITSVVKKVELVSDRMSYIILRGQWRHYSSKRSCPQQMTKLMM